jgi:hypothetical protein
MTYEILQPRRYLRGIYQFAVHKFGDYADQHFDIADMRDWQLAMLWRLSQVSDGA